MLEIISHSIAIICLIPPYSNQHLSSGLQDNFKMQKSQAFETLTLLNEEISEGLRNLSDNPKGKTNAEIEQLKENAYRKHSPEAEFALQLFRKYADIANSFKDQLIASRTEGSQHGSSRFEIPAYMYEGNREQLSGMKATKTNIFWCRTLVVVLTLAGYITLVTIRFMSYRHSVTPGYLAGVS